MARKHARQLRLEEQRLCAVELYDTLKNAVDGLIAHDDAQYLPDQPASPPTVATASSEGSPELEGSEENLHDPTDASDERQQVGTHGAGAAAFDDPNDPFQVCGSPYIYNII